MTTEQNEPLVCEICGQNATTLTIDTVVEDKPVRDEQGRLWRRCHGEGGYRARCNTHTYFMKSKPYVEKNADCEEQHNGL